MNKITIGIDLDNTIVSYDETLFRLAIQHGYIDESTPAIKEKIRDKMRQAGLEEEWIELQGYLYGPAMKQAEPFPGVINFFNASLNTNYRILIISHKTRYPYRGPQYDLHQSSLEWLDQYGFTGNGKHSIPENQVFLLESKEKKWDTIKTTSCEYFIDDLPDFLLNSKFPKGVQRLLFAPHGTSVSNSDDFTVTGSWMEIIDRFFISHNFDFS